MVKALTFIRHYWKSITIITLLIAGVSSVWVLYRDNIQLGADATNAERGLAQCEAERDNLADRLDRITEDLTKAQEQREYLEENVLVSERQINVIRREKDQLLFELERRRDIPEECAAKFQWMIGEFQEIERNFYTRESENE